jgi:hypothetical protein
MHVHEDSEHRAALYTMYECCERMDAQEQPLQLGCAVAFK